MELGEQRKKAAGAIAALCHGSSENQDAVERNKGIGKLVGLLWILDAPPWGSLLHRLRQGLSPEFAVDEVGEPTEEEARGGDEGGDVDQVQYREVPGPREQAHGKNHPDDPSMAGHATLVDREHPPEGEGAGEVDEE